MNTATFESRLLPDGHLYCPNEFSHNKNALFKVFVLFEDNEKKASDTDIELSAISDNSEEEVNYYLNPDRSA